MMYPTVTTAKTGYKVESIIEGDDKSTAQKLIRECLKYSFEGSIKRFESHWFDEARKVN